MIVVGALGKVGVVGLHSWRWVTGGRVLLVRVEIVVGLRVGVLLLLVLLGLLHATGARLALLGRIDGLREGGGSGGIGAAVGIDTETVAARVVVVGNVQVQPIALIVHCSKYYAAMQHSTVQHRIVQYWC